MQISEVTKVLPISLGITGRKRNLALNIMEFFFPLKNVNYIHEKTGLSLDLSNRNERLLQYYYYNVLRYFEKSALGVYISKTIKKGDVFLDIGANIGMYSLLVKSYGGVPIVFEPEPSLKKFYNRNSDVFNYYYNVGISDQEKEEIFYISGDGNVGASSLVASKGDWKDSGYVKTIKIKTSRLNKVLPNDFLCNVKLVKIDVEGAEEKVISGMLETLKDKHFEIWCEVRGGNSDRSPDSYKKIIDMLLPFKYKPYIYDKNNNKLRKFDENIDVVQVFDILFK